MSQNLYLIGLMGVGKTTVGKRLAKLCGLEFLDTDHELERLTGVSIDLIFDIEGEAGFRRRETELLRVLSAEGGCVIATGGGIVLSEENRRLLRKSGSVIYLRASPELLWERTRHCKNRPLLQRDNPRQVLRDLHREREPLYLAEADLVVDVTRNSAAALAKSIHNRLPSAGLARE
ncbi:MAG: shikimate kinase [Pseudomonadota bacterium]|nr:shikimate kinase [Pseudomonadota bacterium]